MNLHGQLGLQEILNPQEAQENMSAPARELAELLNSEKYTHFKFLPVFQFVQPF